MRLILTVLIIVPFCAIVYCQDSYSYPNDNPPELGRVHWARNFDDAVNLAEQENKAVFLLFQEVPGCSNCTYYGQNILSHPLIVEAIEDHFIPLAIYNNKSGHDAEILKHFGEPSWNNPVVRIVDAYGKNLVDRIGDFRSRALLIETMMDALNKKNQIIPGYLEILHQEFLAEENGLAEVYLSMFCFWTGEKEIGSMDGVVSTEAGYMHGSEVVKVKYNAHKTDAKKIALNAQKVKCADEVFIKGDYKGKIPTKKVGKYRKDRQDKYFLLNSEYKSIPMTDYQKTMVNSYLGSRKDPTELLSPRQLSLLNEKGKSANYIEEDFIKAWYSLK